MSEEIRVGEWIDSEDHKIASRLFKMRNNLDMQLSDLSAITGIDEITLSRYETGKETIPASDLFMLATFMGVDMNYFYTGEEKICGSNSVPVAAEHPALLS